MDFVIQKRSFLRFLVGCMVLVVFMHLVTQSIAIVTGHDVLMGLIPLFNLNAEANVPTFFASLLLFLSSALLFVTAAVYKKVDQWFVKYWIFLGLIFAFLTLDEFASIHERLDVPMRTMLGTEGFLHFAWVIPYAVLVLVIGLSFVKFLMRLEKPIAIGFIISGGLFVSGALGMEMLGGKEAFDSGQATLTFILLATVEEVLEMSGVLLFIHFILLAMSAHVGKLQVDLTGTGGE